MITKHIIIICISFYLAGQTRVIGRSKGFQSDSVDGNWRYLLKTFVNRYLNVLVKDSSIVYDKDNSENTSQSQNLLEAEVDLDLLNKQNKSPTSESFANLIKTFHNNCHNGVSKYRRPSRMLCKIYLKESKAKPNSDNHDPLQDQKLSVTAEVAAAPSNHLKRRKRQIPSSYPLGIFLPSNGDVSLPIDFSSLTGNIGLPALLGISNFQLPNFAASNNNKFADPHFSQLNPFSSSNGLFPSDFSLRFPSLSAYLNKPTSDTPPQEFNTNSHPTLDSKNPLKPLPNNILETSTPSVIKEITPLNSLNEKKNNTEKVENLLDNVESKFSPDQSDIKNIYHSIPGTGPTKISNPNDDNIKHEETSLSITLKEKESTTEKVEVSLDSVLESKILPDQSSINNFYHKIPETGLTNVFNSSDVDYKLEESTLNFIKEKENINENAKISDVDAKLGESTLNFIKEKENINENAKILADNAESKFLPVQSSINSIYYPVNETGLTKTIDSIENNINSFEINNYDNKIDDGRQLNEDSISDDSNLSVFINSRSNPYAKTISHQSFEILENSPKLIPFNLPSSFVQNISTNIHNKLQNNIKSPSSHLFDITNQNIELKGDTFKEKDFSGSPNEESKSNSHNDLLLDMFLDQRETATKGTPIQPFLNNFKKEEEIKFRNSNSKFSLPNEGLKITNNFNDKLYSVQFDTNKFAHNVTSTSKPHFQLSRPISSYESYDTYENPKDDFKLQNFGKIHPSDGAHTIISDQSRETATTSDISKNFEHSFSSGIHLQNYPPNEQLVRPPLKTDIELKNSLLVNESIKTFENPNGEAPPSSPPLTSEYKSVNIR